MKKQLPKNIKTLTKALLFLAGAGILTMAAICAPNSIQLLKPLLRNSSDRRYHERKRIREALQHLAKRRLVEFYQKGNDIGIEITESGKKEIQKFDFENLQLPQKQKWDRKWRLMIFDIPEEHKQSRDALQQKLKELDFYPLQKSVWVYPHNCRDEIDFLTSFCEVRRYVHYIETSDLEQKEGDARKFFGLI
ncbi:MAG: hypothetical protein HYW90_04510 [Candidatus Sungbacteria bacterium]|nr:hypothetical protein [Candidatus Sungbacteria bacterium]